MAGPTTPSVSCSMVRAARSAAGLSPGNSFSTPEPQKDNSRRKAQEGQTVAGHEAGDPRVHAVELLMKLGHRVLLGRVPAKRGHGTASPSAGGDARMADETIGLSSPAR